MLTEQIKKDLTESMRNKDAVRLSTLRMLSAEITNAEIALRPLGKELNDEEILKVIQKEAKKHKESIEIFTSSNRMDLAEKEKSELLILEEFLPKQMSEEEVEAIVTSTISENPGIAFGDLMKVLMPKFQGKADGKIVSQLVNKHLNK